MQTSEFLELLKTHQNKELRFEYRPGKLVGANYHITEVKNITVDSVDCGARSDAWKETIIQLWESPEEKDNISFMSSFKAMGILNKVNSIKPLVLDAEVKFEYSNANFHTAQLFVDEFVWNDTALTMKLSVQKTDCKAKEECGVPGETYEKVEACCSPESGCC